MNFLYLIFLVFLVFPFPFLYVILVPLIEVVSNQTHYIRKVLNNLVGILTVVAMTFISLKLQNVSDVAVNLKWIDDIINGSFNFDYIKGEYFYFYLITILSFFISDAEEVRLILLLSMNTILFCISNKVIHKFPNTFFIFVSLFSTALIFPFLMRQSLSILMILVFSFFFYNKKGYFLLLLSAVLMHISSFIYFIGYFIFKSLRISPSVIAFCAMLGFFFLKLDNVVSFFEFVDLDIMTTKVLFYKSLSLEVKYDYYSIFNSVLVMFLVIRNSEVVKKVNDNFSFIMWMFFFSSALFIFTLNIPIMAGRLGYLIVYLAPIFFILFRKESVSRNHLDILVVNGGILFSILITLKRLTAYLYNDAWLKFDLSSSNSILTYFIF